MYSQQICSFMQHYATNQNVNNKLISQFAFDLNGSGKCEMTCICCFELSSLFLHFWGHSRINVMTRLCKVMAH